MVWMRTAALPYFRKLWGRIENGLPKGDYTVEITNRKHGANSSASLNDAAQMQQLWCYFFKMIYSSDILISSLNISCVFFCAAPVEYPVDSFDGKKYFVVSTANAFGGRNSFLGISYLVMGIICFIILAVFVYKKIVHLRTKGQKEKWRFPLSLSKDSFSHLPFPILFNTCQPKNWVFMCFWNQSF